MSYKNQKYNNYEGLFTKEYLEREYCKYNCSTLDIAIANCVKSETVLYYLKKYSIPIKKSVKNTTRYINETLTYDFLYKYYIVNKFSLQNIMDLTGIDCTAISKRLTDNGIEIRDKNQDIGLLGQTIGCLYFKEKIKENNRIKYRCLCKCGKEVIKPFNCIKNYTDKSTCGKCGYYKDIGTQVWNRYKDGAKERNLSFNITKEQVWELYEKQGRKCKYSGVDIEFHYKPTVNTASIDRINSEIGYEIDNIQLVHKAINLFKNKTDGLTFIHVCKLVAENCKDVDTSELEGKKLQAGCTHMKFINKE